MSVKKTGIDFIDLQSEMRRRRFDPNTGRLGRKYVALYQTHLRFVLPATLQTSGYMFREIKVHGKVNDLSDLTQFRPSFKVCQLRERRLDLEEELAEEKKTSETLKKEYDALVKKAKIIDSALKTAEADLEAFQVAICCLLF